MAQDTLLREYIRAALLSLPDPRTGSGYGSSSKSASGLGTQYQKNSQYPYRDPDKYEDEESCEDDQACLDPASDEETEDGLYCICRRPYEAGTFMILALITKGNIKLNNIVPAHLDNLIIKLKEAGALIENINRNSINFKFI